MSEERILDFLDGRLSGSAEEELLHTLAVSPERRQMLRDHLRLRELTSNLSRQSKFAVPDHVSQQLFTKLGALGFAAPPTTAAILTHATDYVKHDKPAERPRAVYWSGRRMIGSLAMASAVSFLLGVSAFYVFGERLGLRTLSEQRSASIVSINHPSGLTSHHQYASASVDIRQDARGVASPVSVGRRTPVSEPVAGFAMNMLPARDLSAGTELRLTPASLVTEKQLPDLLDRTINYTAPVEPDPQYHFAPSTGLTSHYLRGSRGRFDSFDPLPFLSEKGTISFRFGTGRPMKNTTTQWSSLSEMKFTWALGNLITARASLGQLLSWEREASTPKFLGDPIYTNAVKKMIPVAGMEIGLAFDQFGIPVEISGGALADGTAKFYPRASLFGHYDLLPSLSLGVGIEGLAYKHDISSSVNDVRKTFKDLKPIVDPHSVTTSETAGFVGLAFELGWHF
jgi:hypothetical protein